MLVERCSIYIKSFFRCAPNSTCPPWPIDGPALLDNDEGLGLQLVCVRVCVGGDHQVRAQLDLGTVLNQQLESGDCGSDAGVVCDVLVLVQEDIQICPHEHLRHFPRTNSHDADLFVSAASLSP